ncbi:SDR family NAD(P)-dependent oxidoreductase [Amantichitinum ursilacus]|uniref:3-oxoacyl-[acyl-carrier-protein] reductase FabG n=1 Tax=Amantichitinum ursilacus TaxID=857265 RepID=A0A0N0GMC4_9NEIS|nr:SDR family oxidoreductase [Amantichitinum ursilacus]KPC50819.1 3-oxoacyl-[acyl-carrier-protein] reductase FabG [Amantichitinum ursilacus]
MTQKIAIITGGSRGLGKNAALHLARAGVDIVLTYHSNQAAAQGTVTEIEALGRRAVALKLDAGNSGEFDGFGAQVKQALSSNWQTTQFDFLVNNAGIGINSPITETTEETFDTLMNIHLKGPFFITQKLLPLIKDGGRIVMISSGLTRFAFPGYGVYGAMKGGIEVLARYLAKELAGRKIVVNTIAPGAIETDFRGGEIRDNKQANAAVAAATALGRVGLPDDIGGAIAALLSDGSGWINAQRIEVSGGMFI